MRGGIAKRNSSNQERPRKEWIEIPVPAIVSDETFALAQGLLIANKTHAPRRTIQPSICQGMVVCSKCGYALYAGARSHRLSTFGGNAFGVSVPVALHCKNARPDRATTDRPSTDHRGNRRGRRDHHSPFDTGHVPTRDDESPKSSKSDAPKTKGYLLRSGRRDTPLWVPFVRSRRVFPRSTQEPLCWSHAVFTPVATRTVSRHPPSFIPGQRPGPGFDDIPTLSTRHRRITCVRLTSRHLRASTWCSKPTTVLAMPEQALPLAEAYLAKAPDYDILKSQTTGTAIGLSTRMNTSAISASTAAVRSP
jgi:hypothetical protein